MKAHDHSKSIFVLLLRGKKDGRTKLYSEVHHYWPLEEGGDDDPGNMIVMCPNHHAEFDFRIKFINYDMITIINQDGKETGSGPRAAGWPCAGPRRHPD